MSQLDQINSQVLDPSVIKAQGAGKAYQAVATSMAITVQDATDYMRTMSVVSQAALSLCIEKIVVEQDPAYVPILAIVQENMDKSIETFGKMVKAAGEGLKNFPSS